MARKNNGVYNATDREIPASQKVRRHPAMEGLRPHERKKREAYCQDYIRFSNRAKLPSEVVDEVIKMADKANFVKGRNFYRRSMYGNAFALVKFGKKRTREGLRILFTHTDDSRLQAKANPLIFEWDPDERDLHLGVEIDVKEYGAIHAHQWSGRDVLVYGYTMKNGKKKPISFHAYIPEPSIQTDTRSDDDTKFSDAHEIESLDVVPGDASKKEFLNRLKIKNETDLAKTRLFVYPYVTAMMLSKYYITGPNHDCRVGVYASTKALLESSPKFTTIVIGFDKEEVGSGGVEGAKGPFLPEIVDEILKIEENKRLEDITDALKNSIYRNSIAIDADIDVGSTNRELGNVDRGNVAKLGYGMFVGVDDGSNEGDQVSVDLVARIIKILRTKDVVLQTIGSPTSADSASVPSMNEFLADRGIPTINCGVPVGGLHSVTEIISVGDLYYSIRGYQAVIEDKLFARKKPKRKRTRKKKKK